MQPATCTAVLLTFTEDLSSTDREVHHDFVRYVLLHIVTLSEYSITGDYISPTSTISLIMAYNGTKSGK